MEPYERSKLGGVGEGLCALDRAQPLTQLQLGNELPSFRNPLPKERDWCYRPLMKRLTPVARILRRDKTEAEAKLWRYLRNRQMEGAKFRFQSPVGGHVPDFLCSDAKLIVELDGGQHGEQVEKDTLRTDALEAAGYTVIRFWNNDVLANTEGVLETIRLELLNAKG